VARGPTLGPAVVPRLPSFLEHLECGVEKSSQVKTPACRPAPRPASALPGLGPRPLPGLGDGVAPLSETLSVRRAARGAVLVHMSWLTPAKRDRTLDELDAAVEKTNATIKKISSLVQDAERRDQAAQLRQTKLKSILNSVCDTCAAFPCLIPPTSSGQGSQCAVCGEAVISLDPPRRASVGYGMPQTSVQPQPTEAELKRELASHMQTGQSPSRGALRSVSPSPKPMRFTGYGDQDKKFEAPTKKEMMAKAAGFTRTKL
jgi:hypothetical protein